LKALIVNRFGDFALYTAILIIFLTFKTLNFYTIFALNNVFTAVTFDIVGFQINIVELICLFLFIGAVGKSAQVGLHV